MKKSTRKKAAVALDGVKKKTGRSGTGINWYAEDNKVISETMQRGLKYGVRLNMGQAVRMLVRTADLNKLTAEEFQKAAVESDGRRKQKT